jgi:dTDP-4-amino-4,6-dideoxygalactose transaminase
MTGADIRFVDVSPKTFTMDAKQVEAALTPKTRAIVPVHLYGCPANMADLLVVAHRHGLRVIGDAAQAHGALFQGHPIGSLGDVATFSFYPGKNLGAYGDAGAVVTNDVDIADKVSNLRNHGRATKYEHDQEGFNCRMDGLQAAVLSAKLPYLQQWINQRRKHAATYDEYFSEHPHITIPEADSEHYCVYHLYVIGVEDREYVQNQLRARNISTGVHYPIPLHRQQAYAHLEIPEGYFSVSERMARQTLSLPLYPELSEEQVRYVAEQVLIAIQ